MKSIEKLIKEFLINKNIDLDKLEIKQNKYHCEVCGEPLIFFDENGYEIGRDCKCMRQYRFSARIKKFNKYSVINRNEGKDIFSNIDREILTEKEAEIYKKAYGYSKKFAENLKNGGGFLFQGTAGSGKTFLANCICNEIAKQGFSVISLTLSDYFKIIREDSKEEDKFLSIVREVDMLFIDDVGSEQINRKDGSNWGEEKVYNLFNTRNSVQKPMLITTNLTLKELKNHLRFGSSDKIFSRLSQMLAIIKMNFEDKRLKKNFKILF